MAIACGRMASNWVTKSDGEAPGLSLKTTKDRIAYATIVIMMEVGSGRLCLFIVIAKAVLRLGITKVS